MNEADVVVIAGTSDARIIIDKLVELKLNVAATVATEFGSGLIKCYNNVKVYKGKLEAGEMAALILRTGAKCVVDASHPFAKLASLNAMNASQEADVQYLRYERKGIGPEDRNVIRACSFEEAADVANGYKGNIFLTIGSNNLKAFVERIDNYKERVFARVLPDSKVILKCEEAGLSAKNLIAAMGPFSEEMNIAMLRYYRTGVVVTKESGKAGGTEEKLNAAAKLGIPVIIIDRPSIDYGEQVEDEIKLIKRVQEIVYPGGKD